MKLLKDSLAELLPTNRIVPPLSARWTQPWNLDFNDAGRMVRWMRANKIVNMVETGTFEGLGTALFAQTMEEYGGGRITTFDWAGDFENLSVPHGEWNDLSGIRIENLRKIGDQFPRAVVQYVSGDTRETLKSVDFAEPVDFWFQDTMHFTAGILAEMESMKDRLAPGAVVVFDDVNETHPWNKVFAEQYPTWFAHQFGGGHGQLWAQKPMD